MSKITTMKMAMYESVHSSLIGKQSLLDNSPALNEAVNKLGIEIVDLKSLIDDHVADIKWITESRRILTDKMLGKAFRINKVLVAYGSRTGNFNLVNQFSITATDFMKGGFAGKRSRVANILSVLPQYLSELAVLGVTQEDFDELQSIFNEIDQVMSTPRNARTSKMALKHAIEQKIKSIDRFIAIELDTFMLNVKESDPQTFAQYRASRKLVHFASKHQKPGASSSDHDDGGE